MTKAVTQSLLFTSSTTTYALNALGQRTQKTSGLTTTYYIYDEAGHLVYETSGLSSNVAYAYLDDTPVAVMPTTSQIDYIYADQLNTPRLITSTSNSIVWRNDQNDPFNSGAANSSPSGLGTFTFNLRFPGQYYDAETGLNYNINRDYDASTGRYVQSDPIGLDGGINTFAYVNGNLLGYMDPLGLKPWDWNGQGDISKCSYYDDMAKKFTKCDYYKKAARICRGQNTLVNRAVATGLTSAWTLGGLQDSQATVLSNIRDILIQEDKATREANLVDQNGCPCGNAVDSYHNFAFDFSGLPAWSYGGNDWPQSISPNPVPADPRNGYWSPGNWFK
jgi:RHS repeat-associated protein